MALSLVEKEIRTWVGEMGVISGVVRRSEALTLVSWLDWNCLIMVGSAVMAVMTTAMGRMTEKADFRGMPQSFI